MLIGFALVGFMLLVGLATLGTAIAFAARPAEHTLGLIRPLTRSTVFAILGGLSGGIAMAFKNAADGTGFAEPARMLLAGIAEAAVVPVLGCSVLAVAWLVTALGLRRQT